MFLRRLSIFSNGRRCGGPPLLEVEQPKEVCRPFELDFLGSDPHILAGSSKSLGETSEKRQFEVAGETLLVRKKN